MNPHPKRQKLAYYCLDAFGINTANRTHTVTLFSDRLTLEKIYASMEGPSRVQRVYLESDPDPELLVEFI